MKRVALFLALTAPAFAGEPDVIGQATIVDGDTLSISGVRIRLFGVDAPEQHQPCYDSNGASWACGVKATEELHQLTSGREVACATRGSDKYGRLIAKCAVGGADLGARLVASGLAVAYRRYASDYIPQEQAAKNRKVGIWGGSFSLPEDFRHRHERSFQ